MHEYRNDFPMLKQNYIYFNSASTALKPQSVIDAMNEYYEKYSVNTNRGVDSLGYMVTKKYENVREDIAQFMNAKAEEIIFTRGTTSSLNMVAKFLEPSIQENDEIIVSIHEHHANFVPWQQLCHRKKAILKIVKTKIDGTVDLDDLQNIMSEKTKIVALNHISNVFGGINPIKEIAKIVHKYPAYLVIDGAQGIVHEKVDMQEMDADFYAFSGHKIYGPTGIGVLYGKYDILEKMEPVEYGGEMIDIVTVDKTTYKKPPYCFEAGTMMIAEAIGLGKAIQYINSVGYEKMNTHVKEVRNYLIKKLTTEVKDIVIYNRNIVDSNLVTFTIKGIHSHDVASHLDSKKIIVRAGHHCASPLMESLGVTSTIRVSLAFYNTKEECDKLVNALKEVGDYLNVLFK
ncbi:MAG: cysteine desulfurase [Bacilli bacterium]|nr:cysteine desulfurase [Bacilli bacterium]